MSIHAVKAVEIGTGVANAAKRGSEVHDEIFWSDPPPRETQAAFTEPLIGPADSKAGLPTAKSCAFAAT